MKQKEYIEFFAINLLLFIVAYFGFVFFNHYGLDDYSIIADLSELHHNALNNGRFSLMVLYDFFIALGFNPVLNQKIMAILLVLFFALSITSITKRIVELGNITALKGKILINLGALVLLLNVFVTEWFTFVLSYAQWMLGFTCAVYAAILMSYSSRIKKTMAVVLLVLAINAYQIMAVYYAVLIMIFIYLNQKENFKFFKALRDTVFAALIAIIVMALNIGAAKIIGGVSNGEAAARYGGLSFSIENIKKILSAQKNIWIEGKGLFPHGLMLLFFVVFVLLLCYVAKSRKVNWEHCLYCFLIYVAVVLVTFIPQMLEVWLTPRSLVPLFSLLSISIFFIIIWGQEYNQIENICIVSLLLFLGINFYYTQSVAISMFQVNTLEKEHARLIEYEINKYEEEQGVDIESISFYRDQFPKYKYDGIFVQPGEDMFNRAYLADWGDIYALNFYTGLSLNKVEPEKEYIDYFQEHDWNSLDLEEQLIFDGNKCYYCVY